MESGSLEKGDGVRELGGGCSTRVREGWLSAGVGKRGWEEGVEYGGLGGVGDLGGGRWSVGVGRMAVECEGLVGVVEYGS